MRIAFFGHPHHRVTGSSRFMLEELRTLGAVEERSLGGDPAAPVGEDETAPLGEHEIAPLGEHEIAPLGEHEIAPLLDGAFDAVVVWQLERVALRLAEAGLPNVTFFPMYDSCHAYPDSFWRRLHGAKVVSFSSTLHARLQQLGVRVRLARYWPEPPPQAVDAGPGLAGFFWRRVGALSWPTIRALVGDAPFTRFTLHDAPDPGEPDLPGPTPEEAARLHLRSSTWGASPAAYQAELRAHHVYFAPRPREGIGLSFLEAMAAGLLAVAPDRPTMSEYVVSGVNGLLYDPDAPRPLDFSRHRALAARARSDAQAGREEWLRALPALRALLLAPTREVPVRAPLLAESHPSAAARRRPEGPRISAIAPGEALPAAGWVQLLAAGEAPASPEALAAAVQGAPADAELIAGHAILRRPGGVEEVRLARDPAEAYAALRRGDVDWRWLEGLPAPAAILWRADALARVRSAPEAGPLAREEALLRALARGARVHHALRPLAAVPAPPRSAHSRRVTLRALRAVLLPHTAAPAALDAALARMRAEAGRRDLPGLPALGLLLSLGRVPGAFRELKRRRRTRRALQRARVQEPPRAPDDGTAARPADDPG